MLLWTFAVVDGADGGGAVVSCAGALAIRVHNNITSTGDFEVRSVMI
jgi:hypothetical protein